MDIICPNCGSVMEKYDHGRMLICNSCGLDIPKDRLDDWEELYPTYEEVMGIEPDEDEDDSGETYEEVYGELDDD